MSSKIIERLATEFSQLDPSLVADVCNASFGNISEIRHQLQILSQGLCETEEACARTDLHENSSKSLFDHSEFLADSTRCSAACDTSDLMLAPERLLPGNDCADPRPGVSHSTNNVTSVKEAAMSPPICDIFSSSVRSETEEPLCCANETVLAKPILAESNEAFAVSENKAADQFQENSANDISQLINSFELDEDIVASVYKSCGGDLEKAVATLSEMTGSMGIEKYPVFRIIEEDSNGHCSEVTASPLILNNYPCVEEDLICPFGELVYIKIVGVEWRNGQVSASVCCHALKFESDPTVIMLSYADNHEDDGYGRKTGDFKPFWVTGRICAQLSDGLICDEWPPKGYIDPAIDEDRDNRRRQSIWEPVWNSGLDVNLTAQSPESLSSGDLSEIDEEKNAEEKGMGHMWLEQDLKNLRSSKELAVTGGGDDGFDETGGEISNEKVNLDLKHSTKTFQEDRIGAEDVSYLHHPREPVNPGKSLLPSEDTSMNQANSVQLASPTVGFYSCCLPWLQEDLNSEGMVSSKLECESTWPSSDDCKVKTIESEIAEVLVKNDSESVASPVCAPVSALVWAEVSAGDAPNALKSERGELLKTNHPEQAVSPVCAPVSALVWAEVSAGETQTEENLKSEGAELFKAKQPKQTISPVCAPVSALVWAEVSAGDDNINKVNSEGAELFKTNHPEQAISPACAPVSALVWAEVSANDGINTAESEQAKLFKFHCPEQAVSPACVPISASVWAEVSAFSTLDSENRVNSKADDHSFKIDAHARQGTGSPTCAPVSALVLGESLASDNLACDALACEKASKKAHNMKFEVDLKTTGEKQFELSNMYNDPVRFVPNSELSHILDSAGITSSGQSCEEGIAALSRAGERGNSIIMIGMTSTGKGRIISSLFEYDGEIWNDLPHGWGFQQFKNAGGEFSGLTYRGNFLNGLAHCSRGVAVWGNGLEFKGEFIMGCPTCGTLTEPDGLEHDAVFSRDEHARKLWEVEEKDIIEAIGNASQKQKEKIGIEGCKNLHDRILPSESKCDNAEDCGSEYGQQFNFLRNLFPDCENLVLVDLLRDCEGDVEKAIEFLLPAEQVKSVEDKGRSKRVRAVLLPVNAEFRSGAQKVRAESEWAEHGGLAGRLNKLAKQQQLMREFPNLGAGEAKEVLSICGGDVNEARQQLLIMDMSKTDSSSFDSRIQSKKASADHTSMYYKRLEESNASSFADSQMQFQDGSSGHALVSGKHSRDGAFGSLHSRESAVSRQISRSYLTDKAHSERAGMTASAEKEEWQLSKSKRAREGRFESGSGARERKREAQYEDMSGPELRRLGFQHAKMHADLSRMAVSAFQAGDRVEAARLSEKARHHQEQHQILNEMARTKIIEEFNPDMDGRMSVDLHQLHVTEALELLETKLQQWSASANGRRLLVDVVTGAGNHSREGKAVLRPRVKAWLEERRMRYYPINDGLLKVDVSTFPHG